MARASFIASQLILPFKKTSSLVSAALGAVGLVAALRNLIELNVNQFVLKLLNFYQTNARGPLNWLILQANVALPTWTADAILLYVLFGIAATRSLLSVYDPTWDGHVVKGAWGGLSRWIFTAKAGKGRRARWVVYQALAVACWPIIALEYGLRFKYVWRRYLDASHSPNFQARIGTFTSTAAKRLDLLYNDVMGYDNASDTWWRLEGDFRLILLGNVLLSAFATAAIIVLGSLGPS